METVQEFKKKFELIGQNEDDDFSQENSTRKKKIKGSIRQTSYENISELLQKKIPESSKDDEERDEG